MTYAAAQAAGQAPLGGHLWHLLGGLAFFVLTVGGVAIGERTQRAGRAHKAGTDRRSILLPLMAAAGTGAAAVHFVVMPEHFGEATLYGIFFAVAATAQLGYAALLLTRPSRALVAAGVAGNLAMIVLWLITRTVAIPLGPAAGTTEEFGGLDILASSFEAISVLIGATALLRVRRPSRFSLRVLLTPQASLIMGAIAATIATITVLSPPS